MCLWEHVVEVHSARMSIALLLAAGCTSIGLDSKILSRYHIMENQKRIAWFARMSDSMRMQTGNLGVHGISRKT
jgi:hypothetical protein